MKNKPKLIIVEGSQGVGKGAITNMLREKIPYSTLMRLSGIKDKTSELGKEKVYNLRRCELNFIGRCSDSDTTFILDRSHLSEKVYCNLGYKEYDFQKETNLLNYILNNLTDFYDVYIIGLVLSDTKQFETRLNRDKAEVEFSKFNVENSINQQREYFKEIHNVAKKYPNIKTHLIDTAYLTINEVYEEIIKYSEMEI